MDETIPTSLIDRCPRNDCVSRDVAASGELGIRSERSGIAVAATGPFSSFGGPTRAEAEVGALDALVTGDTPKVLRR